MHKTEINLGADFAIEPIVKNSPSIDAEKG